MAYSTGNSLGSTDPRDLSDNSENFDQAINELSSPTWVDRFGNSRVTLAGQIGYRGTGVDGAIESYAEGLELTTYSTIILYSGEFYRPSSTATLPYTTTAALPDVDSNLVAVGDAVLRQDLAASGGALLVTGTVIRVSSRTDMKAYDVGSGYQFSLEEGGRSGLFVVKAGVAPSDPQEGIYVVLSNGNYAERIYNNESVNVAWFGAEEWPSVSTTAIQAALNFVIADNTLEPGSDGSGKTTVKFPKGLFESGPLSIASAIGLKISGAGQQATTIVFTGTASTFLSIQTYIGVFIEDMTFAAGSVSMGASEPLITRSTTPDNICIAFDGRNGGTNVIERNLKYTGWETVYDTTTSTVNEDGHSHYNCRYLYNTNLWVNTNTQAVIWAFNECQIFYTTGNVFLNPGSKSTVYGGDFINPGTFIKGSAANTTTDILLKGLRFENYQNIDPASSPKFLDLSGTHRIQLEQCSSIGGGSLSGKDSFLLSGIYDIIFNECSFDGNINAQVSTSSFGLTPKLTFRRCRQIPILNQTLFSSQGFSPLNVVYDDVTIDNGLVSRRFAGELTSQSQPIVPPVNYDHIKFESSINATTVSKEIPILVIDKYQFVLSKVNIIWWNNTTETVNIKVWDSSAKNFELASFTTSSLSSQHQLLEAGPKDITITPKFDNTSSPLFVEFIAAGNAGTCRALVTVETTQVF